MQIHVNEVIMLHSWSSEILPGQGKVVFIM